MNTGILIETIAYPTLETRFITYLQAYIVISTPTGTDSY